MRLFDRHRRFREALSAYLDGELDVLAAERLDRHLAQCERCRGELEELRATVSALRELPEARLPRSFALTPEQAGASPRRRTAAAAPLAFGMRIAAAGLAVALAAVFVVDLGDFGGDGAAGRRLPASETELYDEAPPEADAGAFQPSGTPATPTAGELAPANARDEGGDATAEPLNGLTDTTDGTGGADAGGAEAGAPPATSDGDGGISALTAAEIALAAALGVALTGSLAFAYAGKKRWHR
jgi:hypothetical protein